jgi:hypothetical protein
MAGTAVVIGGENDARISIEIRAYERGDVGDFEDSNWLNCTFEVAVERFTARAEASFRIEEFEDFLAQLSPLIEPLEGTAKFDTLENQLSIVVKMSDRGTCRISGHATDHTHCTLQFSFESDQTFLRPAIRELKAIVGEFPVRNPEKRFSP